MVLLFCSQAEDTFVIDIPASLELSLPSHNITSCTTLSAPHDIQNEPKGYARDKYLREFSQEHVDYHAAIVADIRCQLKNILLHFGDTNWCYERKYISDGRSNQSAVSRKAEDTRFIPVILSEIYNDFNDITEIQNQVLCHQGKRPTRIIVSRLQQYLIPAGVNFIWADTQVAIGLLQNEAFDLILMDPPWTNKSVKRVSAYITADTQQVDPFEAAMEIVHNSLVMNGCAAIWITNKAAIHQQVSKKARSMCLYLVEEWIWVKVTKHGEPVTALDSVWRKPYEILLIFQKNNMRLQTRTPRRRFVFACPDLHSRKPNLKVLFERFLKPRNVLELFARNLTLDWTSCGNEVLKFQDARLWHLKSEHEIKAGQNCKISDV